MVVVMVVVMVVIMMVMAVTVVMIEIFRTATACGAHDYSTSSSFTRNSSPRSSSTVNAPQDGQES
jgi:hypothetical protein